MFLSFRDYYPSSEGLSSFSSVGAAFLTSLKFVKYKSFLLGDEKSFKLGVISDKGGIKYKRGD